MSRRTAVLFGTTWLTVLFVANAGLLLRPESLRRQVDLALADLFRSRVTYASFEGSWPHDLVLRDVRIMHPDRPASLLASVDEIQLGVAWASAALGGSPVEEVRVVSPHLELAWNANGVLDLPSPLAEGDGAETGGRPRVKVEGLSIHLMDTPFLVKPDVQIELPDFRVSLVPDGSDDWLYQFIASVDDEHLGNLGAFGRFSATGLDLELSRKDFLVTSGMKEILDPDVRSLLDLFKIAGGIQLVGELKSVPEAEEGTQGTGARFRGRIEFDDLAVSIWPDGPGGNRWPQDVSRLRGVIEYEDGRFTIKDQILGFVEGARVKCGGHVDFSRGEPDIKIVGEVLDLEIDDGFVERLGALPGPGKEIREQLRQWELRGPVDVAFSLAQSPLISEEIRLVPNLVVQLQGCDLTYRGAISTKTGKRKGFPYLVRNLRGDIALDDQGLRLRSLHAEDGPVSLLARGTVDYSRNGDETYSAQVWVSGLRVDEDEEELYEAFEPEVAQVLRDLRMQGSVNLQVVAERTRDDPTDVDPEVIISLNGLRLHPKGFPYLLEDARGQVVVTRDGWVKLESLTVRHQGGRLQAWGQVGTGPHADAFKVSVGLRHVVFDEALRVGLKELVPEVVEAMDDLSVRGVIERADVVVEDRAGGSGLSVEATLHLDGASIAPKDPNVTIEDIDAVVEIWHRAGQSRISVAEGGKGSIAGERFDFEAGFRIGSDWFCKLKSRDFAVDEEMLTALEGALAVLGDRNLRPKISGRASAEVTIRGRVGMPATVSADLEALGLKVVPPAWTMTALDDVRCKIRFDKAGFRVTDLVARIPRPSDLPPLPAPSLGGGERPFQANPGIILKLESAGISTRPSGIRVGMTDVELTDVPFETWVLDVLGVSKRDQEALELPPRAGAMNLRFKSAVVGPSSVMLLGGSAELMGIHIGGDSDLYLEEGRLKNFEFALDPRGNITFGKNNEIELVATDFRLFGIPIPHLEARVEGDNEGVTLTGIVGTLFGFDYDSFDVKTAHERELRDRAISMRYLDPREVRTKTAAQLRAIIEREEDFDILGADEATLRVYAEEHLYLSRARARRLDAERLRSIISEKRSVRRRGVIYGETTKLAVTWDGEFSLQADLREVDLGNALQSLGAEGAEVDGNLNSHVELRGTLGSPKTWEGNGWVKASVHGLIRLPVFLKMFKRLPFMVPGTRTDLNCTFDVGDGVVTLTEGNTRSPGLDLELEPPATITFGGIIKARFDAQHKGGMIPLVSDILGVIPGLLLDGVVVEGPLEDPKVEPRSFGVGATTPGTAGGRKPLLKPPRRAVGR